MRTKIILIISLSCFFFSSCKKQSDDPAPLPPRLFPGVNIDSILLLEFDDISIAASYQNPGSDTVLTMGFCWSTSQNPDTTDHVRIMFPANAFSDTINDVGQRTTFYFRAFIKTVDSIYYSQNATIATGGIENNFYKEENDGKHRGIIQVIRAHDNNFTELIQIIGSQASWPQVAKLDLAGNVLWRYEYNPGESREPNHILKVQDGYLFATTSWLPGARTIFVTKIDVNGLKTWEKSFDRKTSQEFVRIAALQDNTVILTTKAFDAINSSGIRTNCSINDFIIDLNGNLISEKEVPVNNSFTQGSYAFHTATVSNDGFVMANYYSNSGSGSDDIIIQKYNSLNQLAWEKIQGTDRTDYPMGLSVSPAGNYDILGYTTGSIRPRAWLMEVDKNDGNKTWEFVYDKNKYGFEIYSIPYAFYQHTAGHYFFSGTLNDDSFPGATIFLLKLNEAGKKRWSYAFQNPKGPITRGTAIMTEGNNEIYLFGSRIDHQSDLTNALFIAKFTEF